MKTKRKPIVKESSQASMVLVPHRHNHKIKQRMKVGLIVILVALICSGGGYWMGVREHLQALAENQELHQKLDTLEQKSTELREIAAVDRHGSVLEKKATERVRQENVQLQDKVAELQEAVSFYKGIMAPLRNDKGLRIEKLSVLRSPDDLRYRYKVVLTQVANNSSYVSGTMHIRVLGTVDGKPKELPLIALSESASKNGAKFKFRYFQDLSGELTLPADFLPEQVEVVAQSQGKKAMRLERLFAWKIEEEKSDVGQR